MNNLGHFGLTFAGRLPAVLLSLPLLTASAPAQVDVLTQHNDNARTGVNLRETVLTPATVNKAGFGMLFKRVVDDQLYTQPLVVTDVAVGGGTRDLVVVTTVNNSVYAFDERCAGKGPGVACELWRAGESAQHELRLPGYQRADGDHWDAGDR